MHLKRAVLALDPGGSKCDAVFAREDGTVLGYAHLQKPGLSGRSPEVTGSATTQAIGGYTFDELHVATFASTSLAGIIRPCDMNLVRPWTLTETQGPLALVGQTVGVVVVAGTGVRVSAQTRSGQRLALDGLGPVLGDFGGGYSIGLRALRATARAALHSRHHTSLKERVFAACEDMMSNHPSGHPSQVSHAHAETMARQTQEAPSGNRDRLQRLVTFSLTSQDRSSIASLAKLVDEEARTGDVVAICILEDAATSIGDTLRDLLDHLQIANDEYVLVGSGGVALNSDVFWDRLCRLVREHAPRFTPIRCPAAPVLGNALFVLRELCPENVDAIRKTLLATAPKGNIGKP